MYRKKGNERKEMRKGEQHMRKAILTLVIISVLFIAACSRAPGYPTGQVHWHATVDVNVCGKQYDLPRIPPGMGHLGSPALHTHDDNVAHMEGEAFRASDFAVGRFMSNVGMPVAHDRIGDFKAGMDCNSHPGVVKIYVNGQEESHFTDYSMRDGDRIEVVME